MAITLGGTALTAAGWFLERTSGLDDVPEIGLETTTIPWREESVVTSPFRPVQPRDAVLTVGAVADDTSALATAQAALQGLLPGSEIILTHTRRPSQRLRVMLLSAPASYGPGPEALAPFYLQYGLRVRAVMPWWEDASEQTVNFTTSAVAVPQGTASTRGVITIAASGGTVTDPVVTYKTSAGATISTLAPTIAILNGDAWRCDVVTGQVRKRVSGVWSNAVDTLPDSFRLPIFETTHGVYSTSSWPTLEVTSGNGSVAYRRRYR